MPGVKGMKFKPRTLEQKKASTLARLDRWHTPEPNTGCWLWTGSLDFGGYGRLHQSETDTDVAAHRLMYMRYVGPIPEGLELDHLCRVRICCNPAHLEPVTHSENVRRGMAPIVNGARNKAKTCCPQGHPYNYFANGRRHCLVCMREHRERRANENHERQLARRMTLYQEVRRLIQDEGMSGRAVGRLLGVSGVTANRIMKLRLYDPEVLPQAQMRIKRRRDNPSTQT